MSPGQAAVSIGFDIGGTFTDVVSLDHASGVVSSTKVLTTPHSPDRAGLQAIRQLLDQADGGVPEQVIHATTLITNAVIERRGRTMGLLATEGHRDALEMRHEQRYDVYDLFITLPEPLIPRHLRAEVRERIAADGSEIAPLDEAGLIRTVSRLVAEEGIEALVVAFLHSYKNPAHELLAGELLRREFPGLDVCLSSDVAPEIGEFERTSTAAVNAYVRGIAQQYLGQISEGLARLGHRRRFQVMLSAGGITDHGVAADLPVRMLESGPAAGVLAAVYQAELVDLADILSFDMGGTTAKFSVIRGRRPDIVGQFEVGRVHRFKPGSGIPVRIPVLDMMEIGAGGGSIAKVDRLGLLKVGPESSGADPGPACYGQGGEEPTVTDADVVLGYIDPAYFLGGQIVLRADLSAKTLSSRIGSRLGLDPVRAAWGVYRVVTENMAAAARVHMAERGCNPLRYAMVAFGGAGPVHACGLAEALQVSRIVCPQDSGVASALGLLVAPTAVDLSHSQLVSLDSVSWAQISGIYNEMKQRALQMLDGRDSRTDVTVDFEASADVRHSGQFYEFTLALPWDALERGDRVLITELFLRRYEELYGRSNPDLPIEFVNWRLRASVPGSTLSELTVAQEGSTAGPPQPEGRRAAWFNEADGFVTTSIYQWSQLRPGATLTGPAIVQQDGSTVVVRPGWSAWLHPSGPLILERGASGDSGGLA